MSETRESLGARASAFVWPELQSQLMGFRSSERAQQWSLQKPANGPRRSPSC